jgi:hypothetical protein
MSNWSAPASQEVLKRTAEALKANGFEVFLVRNGAEAKQKVLEIIPKKSEVLTASSVTVDSIGLSKELNDSGHFDSVKNRMVAMDQKTHGRELRKLGSAPDFVVGSVHAVTETGSLFIASMSGSQLPGYVFGAGTVVWVVGSQKIVKDREAGHKRIFDYVLPLETDRARKAYGLPESFVSYPAKVVEYNREINPTRAKVILVQEALGF